MSCLAHHVTTDNISRQNRLQHSRAIVNSSPRTHESHLLHIIMFSNALSTIVALACLLAGSNAFMAPSPVVRSVSRPTTSSLQMVSCFAPSRTFHTLPSTRDRILLITSIGLRPAALCACLPQHRPLAAADSNGCRSSRL